MRFVLTFPSAALFAAMLVFAPGRGGAQTENSAALRRTLTEFTRLRAELDRVNAEVATLKQADRSVRDDYWLRERMADAEALAQKVTQSEARLRRLGWMGATPGAPPLVAPPQALPQDGSVELEAKAGLFADQARKLDEEANSLVKAADELRSRRSLRHRAGAWDRDPFMGLEGSKRSLAVSASTPKTAATSSSPAVAPPGYSATTTTGGASSDSGSKGAATLSVAPEAAVASKTSPIPQTVAQDRQSFEQRLYLDPTTAAELRHALGTAGATSDPDALDRAATALRARARALSAQARVLLVKSRAP